MSERCRRVNPFETVFLQFEFPKGRREQAHGVDRRTDVVLKAGQSEFRSAAAAADFFGAFDNKDGAAGEC